MDEFGGDESLLRRIGRGLKTAQHVVVFTGAGISAESGIGTFRDDDGLWTRFPPEEFAQLGSLLRIAMEQPGRAAEFLLAVLEPMISATPNAGHLAVSELQQHVRVTVITQNIDGLHELAGSTTVLAVHGRLHETVNADGTRRSVVSRSELAKVVEALRPLCTPSADIFALQQAISPWIGLSEEGVYRPNIVLFGEQLCEPDWTQAQQAVRTCDYLVAVGTSGMVYPAAGLPDIARRAGATVVAIDPQPVAGFMHLQGKAGAVLPALLKEAFGTSGNSE